MKVALVYPDFSYGSSGLFNYGVAAISGALKAAGHQTCLVHMMNPMSDSEFCQALAKEKPDMIGFSAMTPMFPHVKRYAAAAKKQFDVPTICGGVHATVDPEDVAACPDLDFVCVGEGEHALVELCAALGSGADPSGIPSIWARRNGEVFRSPMRTLWQDLDSLPWPDRTIFVGRNGNNENLAFKATRGCPYSCAYCVENLYKKITSGKYLRFRTVDSLLDEIDATRKVIKPKLIGFMDEILGTNKEWLREFSQKYRERIGLPFTCANRVTLMDEENVRLFKEAGCVELQMGIECGNEEFRERILKRKMSNNDIARAFELCHKYNIKTRSFNMVGLPFETWRLALETVLLNARVLPDAMQVTIFYPFPHTDLYDLCKQNGFLTDKAVDSLVDDSVLKQPSMSAAQARFFCRNFHAMARFFSKFYRAKESLGLGRS